MISNEPPSSCHDDIVTAGISEPHRAVRMYPNDEATIAPRDAATPQTSTGPPPKPSMTATPIRPTSAPSTAIIRGRWRSIAHA